MHGAAKQGLVDSKGGVMMQRAGGIRWWRVALAALGCTLFLGAGSADAGAVTAASYSCPSFTMESWVERTSEPLTLSGSGHCVAAGVRHPNTSLSIAGNTTVNCARAPHWRLDGTLTIADGTNPAVTTSASVVLDNDGTGVGSGTINLGSGQTGAFLAIMTAPIIRLTHICEATNDPVRM
jgi:hypothetical protein